MKIISGIEELLERYDTFLFDAYGVILTEKGLLPGIKSIVHRLRQKHKAVYIVSNGSSKSEDRVVDHYKTLGLEFERSEIITSGSLLAGFLIEQGLQHQPVVLIGPPEAASYIERAGCTVKDLADLENFDTIVVANQTGYPFLETMDRLLSHLFQCADMQKPCRLIVPNPDVFYPKSADLSGFTSGAVGMLIERALELRYFGRCSVTIEYLGKPFRPIFSEAEHRSGSPRDRMLMVGDQIYTDITGARNFGIDSLLVATGMTHWESLANLPSTDLPTYASKTL